MKKTTSFSPLHKRASERANERTMYRIVNDDDDDDQRQNDEKEKNAHRAEKLPALTQSATFSFVNIDDIFF